MLRNPLVIALIVLGGFVWLLRSPYGVQVRSLIMADTNVAVVVTPTQVSAPTATAMARQRPKVPPRRQLCPLPPPERSSRP